MNRGKISLLVMACGLLMFTLAACGGNDCGDVCDKAVSCGLNIPNCIPACENAPNQGCGLDCDTDSNCVDYGACVLRCGLTS